MNIKKVKRPTKTLILAENSQDCEIREMVMLIVVVVLRTVSNAVDKRLEELEISGRIETIQTTVFLRWARTLRIVLEIIGWLVFMVYQPL